MTDDLELDAWENETILQYARRVGFWKIACICFEFQIPHFIWGHFGTFAYYLHDLFCPDMWMIRVFPRWITESVEAKET